MIKEETTHIVYYNEETSQVTGLQKDFGLNENNENLCK